MSEPLRIDVPCRGWGCRRPRPREMQERVIKAVEMRLSGKRLLNASR
jgi:hypothetical protein